MTLDAILASLCPRGCTVDGRDEGTLTGQGTLLDGRRVAVGGLVDGQFLGADQALRLANLVVETIEAGNGMPILLLIDSGSQRMSRRDELLGLSQYLAHLATTLLVAEQRGHPTVGLLYGGSAAGAFIATALSAGRLAALPGADPAVMDLPSIARVTKLPLDRLQAMARETPVFAPGLDNFARTGAVHAMLDPDRPLGPQVAALLAICPAPDRRDALGMERKGRLLAAQIADQVRAEAARG